MKIQSILWCFAVVVGVGVGSAGCGEESQSGGDAGKEEDTGETADNIGACKKLVAALECGSFDASSVVACDSYGGLGCDVSEYFDCLSENFSCKDGVPETSKWQECASLATCR